MLKKVGKKLNSKILFENERLDDLEYDNLFIIQNKCGYSFTSDAVDLANFAKCKKDSIIIDLCSGSGVVGILCANKNKAKFCYLVELQKALSNMCVRSINYNNQNDKFKVINKKLQNIHKFLGVEIADCITCNPPYLSCDNALQTGCMEKNIAKFELKVKLCEIIKEASKLLKFGGTLYMVNRENRLADIICFSRKFNMEVKIVKIKKCRANNIVLTKIVKGAKSGMRIEV